MRAPAATRSAIIRAASAGADRRTGAPSSPSACGIAAGSHSTKSAPGRGAPSSVTARTGRPSNRSGRRRRVGRPSPTPARTPDPIRTSGPAGPGAAAPVRRATRRPRGRRGTRRRPRTAAGAAARAQRRCPGSSPRCSMSGLVSTQEACARAQSRSTIGVSPSYGATRSPGSSSDCSDAQLVRRRVPWSARQVQHARRAARRAARTARGAGRPATCPRPCRWPARRPGRRAPARPPPPGGDHGAVDAVRRRVRRAARAAPTAARHRPARASRSRSTCGSRTPHGVMESGVTDVTVVAAAPIQHIQADHRIDGRAAIGHVSILYLALPGGEVPRAARLGRVDRHGAPLPVP